MMESPKLGRKKSTALFYFGNAAACGLVMIAFIIDYSKMVLPMALMGKLCGAASFTMVYIWAAELFPTDIRSSGLACASVTGKKRYEQGFRKGASSISFRLIPETQMNGELILILH